MKIKLLYFAVAALIITSCKTEDDPLPPAPTGSNYILVGNEGAFFAESASLTVLDREESSVSQNAFAQANDDALLGDVLQSMYQRGDEIYLVVNNSGKIEVVDSKDFTSKRTITGFASPRYISFVSDEKAYVSNYSENNIDVINPKTGTFTTSIPTQNYIESMKTYNGEIWCTSPGSDNLYFLDLSSDQITDSLTLSLGVTEIGQDANEDFWVFAKGAYSAPEVVPAIYHINGETKEIVKDYQFPIDAGTGLAESMSLSSDGQSVLYLMNNELYKMSISANSLPETPFISNLGFTAYALNVNSETGEIALTDAVDYTQAGAVHFYSATGEPIEQVETGISPHSVLWVTN